MNSLLVLVFVIIGIVLLGLLWIVFLRAILKLIKTNKKLKHPGVCDHGWNYEYRIPSSGLGSFDQKHYKCRYCGAEKDESVPYKFG
jgi:hypothetical protein